VVDADRERLSLLAALKPTLFVTLRTDVVQAATPAAVQEYRASINVEWSPDNGPEVDLETLSSLAHVDAEHFLPEIGNVLPETLVIPVGQAEFFSADLLSATCWQELSARGLDVGLVGEALFGEAFDLAKLRSVVDLVHGRALIVNSLEIAPAWRGAGFGLLAMELAIGELGRGADVAALYPMKPGVADLAERAAVNRALSEYWARVGFVDFNGIMIRDLSGHDEDDSGE
jgi:GNAT superfamily N-acetyltransferase